MVPVKEHDGWHDVVMVGIRPLGLIRRHDFE
jgi:hypothetical protein